MTHITSAPMMTATPSLMRAVQTGSYLMRASFQQTCVLCRWAMISIRNCRRRTTRIRLLGALADTPQTVIESVEFDDSSSLTFADIVLASLATGAGDDAVRLVTAGEVAGLGGNDVLDGSGGDDILSGGTGDDLLRGAGATTSMCLPRATGRTALRTEIAASTTLPLQRALMPADVAVSRRADFIVLHLPGEDRIDLLVGANSASNFRVEFADGTIWDSATLDAMATTATAGDDLLFGTDDQAEIISGLAGDDRIVARGGNDVLAGNTGVDLLEGGLGSDTYLFNLGDGQDRIIDAGGSADALEFGAGIAAADLLVEQSSDGSALILKIAGTTDRVRIETALGEGQIETVRFADGTELAIADLLAKLPTNLDDNLFGDENDNVLIGKLGDDRLIGRGGDDTYGFTRGDGRDLIRDEAQSTGDRLEISGYTAAELTFVRLGTMADDVVIRFVGTDDEIIIVDALNPDNGGIETIALDDGTTYNVFDIGQALLAVQSSDRDEVIIGTNGDDVIEASKGDDLIDGLGGNDRYIFRAGDGDDRMDAFGSGSNILEFTDYSVDDVALAVRGGPGNFDLVITFTGSDDRVILTDALGPLNGADGNTIAIRFADDTIWTRDEMRARALADIDTEADDNTIGFDGDDVFDLQGGDDFASGGAGSDSYIFAAGDGHDIIEDAAASLTDVDTLTLAGFNAADASVERLFKGSDSIVIRFAGNDADSVTVLDALADDGRGLESYSFADGTVWDRAIIRTLLDNADPVASDDGFFSVITGNTLLIPVTTLLRNDFDPDNDVPEIVGVDGGDAGIAVLDGTGNVAFTPSDGFTGATTFTYRIGDGNAAFAEASVSINVRPIAEARDDTGFTVAEDGFLTIDTTRLLSNDIDGDRMIIGEVFSAVNGTVALASNGTISFTPDADYNGPAQFSYAANTPEGGRAEATVTIDVTPVNDAPTARADFGFTTDEDVAFIITPASLLANDSDIDGNTFSIISVQSSDTVQVTLEDSGIITVTPVPFVFGNAFFDYTIADADGLTSTARVSLFIAPVNNAPEPQDDYLDETQGGDPILEDNPIIINIDQLAANDLDRDGDVLVLSGVRADCWRQCAIARQSDCVVHPGQQLQRRSQLYIRGR